VKHEQISFTIPALGAIPVVPVRKYRAVRTIWFCRREGSVVTKLALQPSAGQDIQGTDITQLALNQPVDLCGAPLVLGGVAPTPSVPGDNFWLHIVSEG